ncbi:F-box domain-containing protein [Orpheovirus IHUMI-LCC2]|uniref:F-box domain-containing protein n=1 Tax=Orpheovirus IHUMI-LCC2 TaxID=2023057 RepID=A0A2I2L4F0_9VIRU|nr:F-box domain-containing protein [Orpheovirus IHUMI-LCC2]SNW62408.1 F-box domain-containing protein [Orpheovirus IHUMI-LCC2]
MELYYSWVRIENIEPHYYLDYLSQLLDSEFKYDMMELLPSEIINIIFSYVALRDICKNVRLINRNYKELSDALIGEYIQNKMENEVNDDKIHRLVRDDNYDKILIPIYNCLQTRDRKRLKWKIKIINFHIGCEDEKIYCCEEKNWWDNDYINDLDKFGYKYEKLKHKRIKFIKEK